MCMFVNKHSYNNNYWHINVIFAKSVKTIKESIYLHHHVHLIEMSLGDDFLVRIELILKFQKENKLFNTGCRLFGYNMPNIHCSVCY